MEEEHNNDNNDDGLRDAMYNAMVAELDDGDEESDDGDLDDNNEDERSDDNENEDDDDEVAQPFDPELPTRHSYLGESSLLSGRTLLEEDALHELVVLSHLGSHHNVILMPNQTMPLTLFHPVAVAAVQHLINTTKIFGLLFRGLNEREGNYSECEVGVTAEMLEYRAPSHPLEIGFKLKIKGRQRFRLISSRTQSDGTRICTVKILPEIVLESNPFHSVRVRTMDKFAQSKKGEEGDKDRSFSERKRSRQVSSFNSILSPLPPWSFAMYDAEKLVQEAQKLVSQNGSVTDVPNDPVELSFWLPLSFPIDDRHLIKLLKMNCAVQRLRYQICLLKRYQVFCCRVCGAMVGRQSSIFSMNREGPQSAYVNPGGVVHETLTLTHASNISLVGRASTEFSWFPGYSWTIAQCSRCTSHLGWKFVAAQSNLKPRKFFGVSRRSILPALDNNTEQQGGTDNQKFPERFRPVM